ncbi:ABC-type oligopeptide transporter ABCB9-like isoform X3 [Branchiostoma lanceolatum]|uniref:ABC-type oligopeptide transporter ABCB9-like isoform X3 n=1 Tax=Branchiostoma lanceolatum TaxID=7740 RepID=UPI0034537ACB
MAGKANTVMVAAVVLLSLADVAINTILYMNGADLHKFTHDISFFSIFTSLLDIWILALLRGCVMFGAVLSVLCNTRTKPCTSPWILVLPAAICAYTFVKLLLYSEKEVEFPHTPWFWGILVGSIVGSAVFYINWTLLSHASVNPGNGIEEETERLLEREATSESNSSPLTKLISYAKPVIPYFLAAMSFLIGGAVSDTFIPYYTGQVIDGIAKIKTSQDKFVHAIIFMTILIACSAVCFGMRTGLFEITKIKFNIRVRNLLLRSITRQEIGFFDSVKTGEIISRLSADTTITTEIFINNVKVLCACTVRVVGIVAFMLKLSWRLSILTLIMLPIIAVVSRVFGGYLKKVAIEIQTSFARANEVADETCANMRTVRSFANEDTECERYSELLEKTYKLHIRKALLLGSFTLVEHAFDLALFVLTLYYGGHLVMTHKMTAGHLVAFYLYLNRLRASLKKLTIQVYARLMEAVGASTKVIEFIDRVPKVRNGGQLAPSKLRGSIEFKNVWMSYPSRRRAHVLKDVSFKVSPGEVVALVGPSGSGKSTCVNLLEHFYETMSGQVLLDGNPIKAYDHKFLHRRVALVGQEPVLFARSIKDNISYALDNCSLEEVQRVARQANAHQFITELPEGYETEAGEKGMQLSGGQKQRVAIARALIRRPAVLLLDEATSALDSESEQMVEQATQNLHGHTVIVIAHRLSTVEKADRIIVIDKGRVAEQGRHKELMQRDGLYAKMVRRQLLGLDTSDDTEAGDSLTDDDYCCKESGSSTADSSSSDDDDTDPHHLRRSKHLD